jgi:hypothetical protein
MDGHGEPTVATLVLTFAPREHGKIYKGKLVIDTEGYTWVYALHGGPQTYVAPVPPGVQVDDHMDPRVLATMKAAHDIGKRRNYVASAGSGAGLLTPDQILGMQLAKGGHMQYPGGGGMSGTRPPSGQQGSASGTPRR